MSSNSVNPIPCTLCGEGGHRERRCPDLSPESDGFWKGQRMADDEEEECCKINSRKKVYVHVYTISHRKAKHQPYNKLLRNKTK